MSARTQPRVTAAGVTGQKTGHKSRAPRASRGTAPAARRRSAKSIEPAPAPVLLDRDQYPPHLQWPETLYDTDVVGHNKEFDAKLADASAVIHAWAESVECGDIESVTPEATEAAEWIRQALTAKIDKNDKDLAVKQSKTAGASDGDNQGDLVLMAQYGSVHALLALQAMCHKNSVVCGRLVKSDDVFKVVKETLEHSPYDQVRCSAMALASAILGFNDETHKIAAKNKMAILVNQELARWCTVDDDGAATCTFEVGFQDLRGMDVCDHAGVTLRHLSTNAANHNMLKKIGCVDLLLNLMAAKEETSVRINAAVCVADIVGRDDMDSRMENDPTIIEETLAALEDIMDGNVVESGITFEAHELLQGLANLANVDATKRRIADAGAVPLIVRALLEPQYKWDLVMLYAAAALWNLSFDDAIKEEIKTCPGALDGLEEVNKVGSETTKAKARGALWMLNADDETEVDHKISEDKVKILTGGGSTANTQIMLSYEWHSQTQAMALRDELVEEGYTVWMDVDRMMGSTLEAMAAAIESSDAIVMCVTNRYKESQACRTEAEYAYTRKKLMIPAMLQKGYKPDGWLGILMGSKLYYNMFNQDDIRNAMPAIRGEVGNSLGDKGGGGANGGAQANQNLSSQASVAKEIKVPENKDSMALWLENHQLGPYIPAFKKEHMYGKALLKLHEEIGHGDPEKAAYHELFQNVLGITSYGHRLLLLAELEELIGPIKWKRR